LTQLFHTERVRFEHCPNQITHNTPHHTRKGIHLFKQGINKMDLHQRRQAILSTGDNLEEWLAAGADVTELTELGLLDDTDEFALADLEAEPPAQQSQAVSRPAPTAPADLMDF
jgi:hypothetical protein